MPGGAGVPAHARYRYATHFRTALAAPGVLASPAVTDSNDQGGAGQPPGSPANAPERRNDAEPPGSSPGHARPPSSAP